MKIGFAIRNPLAELVEARNSQLATRNPQLATRIPHLAKQRATQTKKNPYI
ncbi:MAG: hypothetical protein IPP51_11450 [Bacteroidetes bacterium]|nr:hypothetical protein [Bacteroidota bacterium]